MAGVNYGSLPFSEQISFFRRKLNLPTESWTDIFDAEHDHAFVIAGANRDDLVADFRAALDKAISQGTTLAEFRKDFDRIVATHGWSYKGGRGWRSRVIYDTNLRTSYAAGRYQQMQSAKASRPYWRYRHSIAVTHARPQHLAWDGLVLSADDPWWQTHYAPNGWGCFPGWLPIRCDARVGLKTWYAGKMVEFHTRSGHRFTATANHPVLTSRGWRAAHQIQEGDELIGACADGDPAFAGIVDHEQPPTRAEDLFESLAVEGFRIVPMTPNDFHRDAQLREPEIHVAGSDRVLMDVIETARRQFIGQRGFERALHSRIESAHIAMGASQISAVINDPVGTQDAADSWFGTTNPSPNLGLAGQASAIKRQDFALDRIIARVSDAPGRTEQRSGFASRLNAYPALAAGITASSPRNATAREDTRESASADTEHYRQLLEANAGLVTADKVIFVREFDWSGHVYDFSTATGLIIAAGLVVSNCQCFIETLAARDLRRLGKDGPDTAPPIVYRNHTVGTQGPTPRAVRVPEGIDPGFAYTPGASAASTAMRLYMEHAAALPPAIAALGVLSVLSRARLLDALETDYQAWIDGLRETGQSAGELRVIGAMRPETLDALMARGQEPNTAGIVLRDEDFLHLQRDAKRRGRTKAGQPKALTDEDINRLPRILAQPQAVLFDTERPALLYVFDSSGGRTGKFVVHIDFTAKVRDPKGKRVTELFNVVRSGGQVELKNLRAPRYELLEGQL